MTRSPVLFASHGSPTVALEDGAFGRALAAFGARTRPSSVVVVSAHWEERGPVRVGAARRNAAMHDFRGFPPELHALRYPAPGDPDLAARLVDRLDTNGIPALPDPRRPLDHGAWVPLRFLYPAADVPVVPVSLPRPREPRLVARIGELAAPFRDEGVLLLGSGGAVHNLGRIALDAPDRPDDDTAWARDFDRWLDERVRRRDLEALLDYRERAPWPETAHPTSEHLDPLFFVLGASLPGDRVEVLHEGFEHGSLSMRTFALG
jgi:4,5-DOPA dioxygenase extradiol